MESFNLVEGAGPTGSGGPISSPLSTWGVSEVGPQVDASEQPTAAASAAASAMPPGILAGARQRELVCPRFFDEDGLGDLRGDVSGTCTPLVEGDLEALFDDCDAAIGAKAEDELFASPVEGDGAGAALSSSSSTDLPSLAPARPPAPRPRPKTLFSRASKTGEAS